MSIKVRIPYKTFLNIPPVCVCCGSSNAQRSFYVSQTDIVASIGTEFPLCDKCNNLINRRKGSYLIVLVSILASISILFLFQGDDRFPANILTSIIAGALLFLLLRLYVIQRGRRGLTQDEINLQDKALHAVEFVWPPFFITFKFENEYYGRWFAALNNGKIVGQ